LPLGFTLEPFMLQALATHAAVSDAAFAPPPEKANSPTAVRDLAVELVSRNQMGPALAVVEEALALEPDSQELLSMAALISEAVQDWVQASHYLERLVRVQGSAVTAETLCHWVRVLRCLGQLQRAARLARQAQQMFPEHPLLKSEHQTLASILNLQSGV
jgi:Tfp pilus assembly protein PilF